MKCRNKLVGHTQYIFSAAGLHFSLLPSAWARYILLGTTGRSSRALLTACPVFRRPCHWSPSVYAFLPRLFSSWRIFPRDSASHTWYSLLSRALQACFKSSNHLPALPVFMYSLPKLFARLHTCCLAICTRFHSKHNDFFMFEAARSIFRSIWLTHFFCSFTSLIVPRRRQDIYSPY